MQEKHRSTPKIADEARQSDPAPSRWDWVERSVWTARMLRALESGVKGGKWHSLIDKVYKASNLHAACQQVISNAGSAGVDHVTIEHYRANLSHNQSTLAAALRDGSYRPRPVRRTYIEKPGSSKKRPLGIPCVQDRVAQTALKHVIEPIFEQTFADSSYGFRPGRGCHDALQAVEDLLHQGYVHIVDADIQGYFDNIPVPLLLTQLRQQIGDGRVLDLLELFLQQPVFDGLQQWQPDAGVPQGAVISPLLANVFLNPFDWYMKSHGIQLVRYADDFVLLCRSTAAATRALDLTRQWMQQHQLSLHPEKTQLVDMTAHRASFTFLGYEFLRNVKSDGTTQLLKLVSPKAQARLRERIRRHTPRQHGHSLDHTIGRLNQTLRGWYNYFAHCSPCAFYRLDGMVRRRLRRILRKRHHQHTGTGRALSDHKHWPNSLFANLGLFSLDAVSRMAPQSLRSTH